MTWLTLRQHRWVALIALAGAAGLVALFMAYMGPTADYVRQVHVSNVCDGTGCFTNSTPSHPPALLNGFISIWLVLAAIPALFGIFVGAPLLAREYESGTHRLIWAQGITRRRWLAAQAGGAALAALAVTGAVAAAATAYSLVGVGKLWSSWDNFDASLVLVGHTLFALALGIAAGALLRRTIPAMAVTLGLFVAVRVAVAMFIRPYFQWPKVGTKALSDQAAGALAQGMDVNVADRTTNWVLNTAVVDAHGHVIDPNQLNRMVMQYHNANPQGDSGLFLSNHGITQQVFYQPAERFWLFQGMETLLFLGLAVALIGFSLWWIRRRPA